MEPLENIGQKVLLSNHLSESKVLVTFFLVEDERLQAIE
jgi:hypothetical protein